MANLVTSITPRLAAEPSAHEFRPPAELAEGFSTSAGIILFASHLVIALARSDSLSLSGISVTDATGVRCEFQGWAMIDHLDPRGGAGAEWRLIAVKLPRGFALDLSRSLKVQIDLEDADPIALTSRVTRLAGGQQANPVLKGMVMAAAASGTIDTRAAAILDDRCRWIGVSDATPVHFAPAIEADDVLLLEGWIKDLKLRSIALMNRDLTSFLPVEEMVLGAVDRPGRPKQDRTRRGTLTRLESFIGSLELRGSQSDEIFLVETAGGDTTISGPYLLTLKDDPQRILLDLNDRIENEAELRPANALASIEAFASGATVAPNFAVSTFGPAKDASLSVVIALSGDEIFLQSILHQFDRIPAGVELVLGLEASAQSPVLTRYVATRKHRLKGRVKIVTADSICGPTRLRNACAEAASGDTLVFADEGAWFDNRRPWLAALLALRERSFDIVGVGARFEDGSIDNEGIGWTRDDLNPRLFSLEYTNRGFPAGDHRSFGIVEPVGAVSSVGMATTRGRFFAIGKFDERYDDAIYADAEFAFRARLAGASIGFVRGSGLVRAYPQTPHGDGASLARRLVDRLRFSVQMAQQSTMLELVG